MLELKKLITAFIVPPGFFIVILFIVSIWMWRRKLRWSALINILLALLLWAVSTTPLSNVLLANLEYEYKIPPNVKADVIILLGGGIHEGVPDFTGRGTPSEDMLARLVTAVRLNNKLHIPVIVSGGSVFSGRSPEAPVIRRFLLDLGVRNGDIILESQSRDTMENAFNCRKLLTQYGFKSPLLVTSAYHMRRSIQSFQKAGVAIKPFPAQFMAIGTPPVIWADFLPSSGALMKTSTALKEYFGLLFNWLTK